MADGLNKVMLIGNLGQEPDLKSVSGTSVLSLRIATTESFLNSNKERQERTEWHSITLWGKRAEGLSKILKKGERIFVEGRLQTRSWDDKTTGQKRYSTEIVAINVILLGGARGRSDGGDEVPPASGDSGAGGFPSDESEIPF